MNAYVLVEGKKTEMKVYPAWLEEAIPSVFKYSNVIDVDPERCGYFIFSGMGMPRLLTTAVPSAVMDIKENPDYTHLIIVVDSEDESIIGLEAKIKEVVSEFELPEHVQLNIIIQHVCIETWFLGNKSLVGRGHQCEILRLYLTHGDVSKIDPESVVTPSFLEINRAKFHEDYLKKLFKEKNMSYSKARPQAVMAGTYFQKVKERWEFGDLQSFGGFIKLINDFGRAQNSN